MVFFYRERLRILNIKNQSNLICNGDSRVTSPTNDTVSYPDNTMSIIHSNGNLFKTYIQHYVYSFVKLHCIMEMKIHIVLEDCLPSNVIYKSILFYFILFLIIFPFPPLIFCSCMCTVVVVSRNHIYFFDLI